MADNNRLYRDKEFQDIADLLSTGEGIRIHGFKGVGTSKQLRYIHNDKSTKAKYFKKYKTFFFNLSFTKPNEILKTLKIKLKEKDQNLVIFANAEKISMFNSDEMLYLRSLRYDKNCIFIFGHNNESELPKNMRLEILCPHSYEILPFDNERMILTVKDILRVWGKKLSEKQIKEIAIKSKGFPAIAKVLISEEILSKKETREITTQFTKNELIIYKILEQHMNEIVSRNDLCIAISPKSEGCGVSNEAIDQIVKRIRSKLKANNSNYKIITKYGFGYYLSQ